MCQSFPDFPNLIEDLDPYAIGNPAQKLQNKESFCFIGSGDYSASKINSFYYVFLLLSLDGSHELEQQNQHQITIQAQGWKHQKEITT